MSDLIERAQKVKLRWTMDMVVEQLLGEPVPASRKITSPFNEADETPSFHVYDDSYYDYSTGKHGDVITLIRDLRHCSFEAAIELLESEADNLGLEAVEHVKVEKPPFKMPGNVAWGYTRFTGEPPIAGVSNKILGELTRANRVGTTSHGLAIVHGDPWLPVVLGIKYRDWLGRKTSEPGSDFSSFLYQPFSYMAGETFCVITEGETDSWAWLSVRPEDHVYSLPSGAQSWRDKFLDQLEGYDKVYIAFDQDEAGLRARDKVTSAVGWARAEHVRLPHGMKDVRESVAAGWKPMLSVAQYHDSVAETDV